MMFKTTLLAAGATYNSIYDSLARFLPDADNHAFYSLNSSVAAVNVII